jgi:hypothetical protein
MSCQQPFPLEFNPKERVRRALYRKPVDRFPTQCNYTAVMGKTLAEYFGGDYGAQHSMLFSPRLWRRLIKPRLAMMFAAFRDAGLPAILHSDDDVRAILPDLVEIGVTGSDPGSLRPA